MQTIACTHKIYDEPFSIVWQAGRQAGVQTHIQRQPDTGDGTLFAKRLKKYICACTKEIQRVWQKFE